MFEYKHADTFAHTKYMPLGTHSMKENILDPLKQSTGSVICPLNTRNKNHLLFSIFLKSQHCAFAGKGTLEHQEMGAKVTRILLAQFLTFRLNSHVISFTSYQLASLLLPTGKY